MHRYRIAGKSELSGDTTPLRLERARKRQELLAATEHGLGQIQRSVQHPVSRLRGRDRINRRVGREANRRKMEKHFDITVTDDDITWSRNERKIAAEARLDGIYVIRTSLDATAIGTAAAVQSYKSLARVERAFRLIKTTRLGIRPVHVYSAEHVRAHVFLCMLAHYVEWNLRRKLVPLLFEDDDREGAQARRNSPVDTAEVSDRARDKARTKTTPDGLPVHSMTTLLADLATLTLIYVTIPAKQEFRVPIVSNPTRLQSRAFQFLEIDPGKIVPSQSPG